MDICEEQFDVWRDSNDNFRKLLDHVLDCNLIGLLGVANSSF